MQSFCSKCEQGSRKKEHWQHGNKEKLQEVKEVAAQARLLLIKANICDSVSCRSFLGARRDVRQEQRQRRAFVAIHVRHVQEQAPFSTAS